MNVLQFDTKTNPIAINRRVYNYRRTNDIHKYAIRMVQLELHVVMLLILTRFVFIAKNIEKHYKLSLITIAATMEHMIN